MKYLIILNILFAFHLVNCQTSGNLNKTNEVQIKTFPGILGSNCYVISQNKTGFIIDAGLTDSSAARYLKHNGIQIKYVFFTHSHIDHVLYAMEIKKATGAKILLHSADVNHYKYYTSERIDEWIKSGEITKDQMPFIKKFMNIKYDSLLSGGETFQIADMTVQIIHTPGHSRGSICILVNRKYLFTGDTIYYDSIGNTDIDSGDDTDIMQSLKEKILPLNDSIIIFQGHGDSKILKELRNKIMG